MNNLLRGIIAGIGAKKFGGGCLGTVLVFIIIWTVLGQCSNTFRSIDKTNKAEQRIENRKIKTKQKTVWNYNSSRLDRPYNFVAAA